MMMRNAEQPPEIEKETCLFVMGATSGPYCPGETLWKLWAIRLEHQPESRAVLGAIGDVLKKAAPEPQTKRKLSDNFEQPFSFENYAYSENMKHLFVKEHNAVQTRLPFQLASGETRLWHHLLLYGGAQRLSAATALLKAGFEPWKDEHTTPLPLLLATGDVALCKLLFDQKTGVELRAEVTRLFGGAEETPDTREQGALLSLARWCLQHEAFLKTGDLLASRMNAPFSVQFSYEQNVALTQEAVSGSVAETWWRRIHQPEAPPPFPEDMLNAFRFRARAFSFIGENPEVTRLRTLFQEEPVSPSASATVSEEIQKKRPRPS